MYECLVLPIVECVCSVWWCVGRVAQRVCAVCGGVLAGWHSVCVQCVVMCWQGGTACVCSVWWCVGRVAQRVCAVCGGVLAGWHSVCVQCVVVCWQGGTASMALT